MDRYCIFDKNLYIGKHVKDAELIKWKLRHGVGLVTIFLIIPAQNKIDQLEIVHAGLIKQKYYKKNPVHVYGIARGYSEALDLVVKISDEAITCGFDGRLSDYLNAN